MLKWMKYEINTGIIWVSLLCSRNLSYMLHHINNIRGKLGCSQIADNDNVCVLHPNLVEKNNLKTPSEMDHLERCKWYNMINGDGKCV